MSAAVRIVLVEPSGPANLGAVCRAMANFGMSDLVLVAPRCSITDQPAIDFARHGRGVLEGARCVDSIPEALAGCVASFAATSKAGLYQRQAAVTAREAAEIAVRAAADGPVAFAFGREDHGLLTTELLHFDRVVSIPAAPAYPVLNLAAAVTVMAYEVFQACLTRENPSVLEAAREPLALDERKHAMYHLLFEALDRIGFFRGQQYPDHLRQALRHALGRAALRVNEVDILIGMARQIGWYAEHHGRTGSGCPRHRAAMEVSRTIADCRRTVQAARHAGRRVVFVPTMGALHAGHVSLMAAAKSGVARNDASAPEIDGKPASQRFLVVSIFVNPTQFGPGEDYARYPRDEEADLATCRDAGVDLVFAPGVEEMYATRGVTTIHVDQLSETLCGPHRPGHFDAVATVVAKLFNIVQPDAAYFGEKDYQQLAVVRRMALDLNLPVEVIGCPTARESDGLALSSRNRYLSPAERAQAASLHRGLKYAAALIAAGQRDAAPIREAVRREIENAGPLRIDYISIVDPDTLQPVATIAGPVQIALAVRIGNTRLIDNLRAGPPVDPSAGRP